MFQNLLVDRFNLKFHKETRTLPAYELVMDKSGPKLKENPSPETFDIPIRGAGRGRIEATHCSMSYFAWNLAMRLDQPVIDQTGLGKFYDFKLEWTPGPPPGAPGGGADAGLPAAIGPDLFTALRDSLA